jgi:hypothetical protein
MHEKLTAFLELEAALWIFNQGLSFSNPGNAAFYWRSVDQSEQIQKLCGCLGSMPNPAPWSKKLSSSSIARASSLTPRWST